MIVNDNTFSKIEIIKKNLTTSSIWHPLPINYLAKVGPTNYQRKKMDWV